MTANTRVEFCCLLTLHSAFFSRGYCSPDRTSAILLQRRRLTLSSFFATQRITFSRARPQAIVCCQPGANHIINGPLTTKVQIPERERTTPIGEGWRQAEGPPRPAEHSDWQHLAGMCSASPDEGNGEVFGSCALMWRGRRRQEGKVQESLCFAYLLSDFFSPSSKYNSFFSLVPMPLRHLKSNCR